MRIAATILFILGAMFSSAAIDRWRLPYNEQGRYFDVENGIVLDEDGVLVYVVIALILLLAASCLLLINLIHRRKEIRQEVRG